jgi:hypothetical protein
MHVGLTGTSSSGGRYYIFVGNLVDEDAVCGRDYCGSLCADGSCRPTLNACTCLAGIEVEVHFDPGPATCTVELELKDPWGASGFWRQAVSSN